MRKLAFIVVLIAACAFAKAQGKLKHADTIGIGDEALYNDDDYTRPSFPGGLKQFYKYLAKNIRYPKNAVKNHIQGKVYLIFVIEIDGSIGDIKVNKGVSKEIDAEAIRVLKNSPKWIPGTHHRKPEPVRYRIPMNFELPKKSK
jgi:TonB family protein